MKNRSNQNEKTRSLTIGEKLLSATLRSFPIKHGKHRILDRMCPKPWANGGSDVFVQYKGAKIRIGIDDLVGWHFVMLKSFDPEVAEVLCKSASANTDHIFWDIGANRGVCSYAMSYRLPSAKIVAIEPQSHLREANIFNLDQTSVGRYEYFQVGVGMQDEELELIIPSGNAGKATLHADGAGPGDRIEKISITTAQSIVEQSSFGWPTLVKIDVEGHEPVVIESLFGALESGICEAIVFENHYHEAESFDLITGIAGRARYSIFGIVKSIFSTKVVPAHGVLAGVTDYVMVSEKTLECNAVFRSLMK